MLGKSIVAVVFAALSVAPAAFAASDAPAAAPASAPAAAPAPAATPAVGVKPKKKTTSIKPKNKKIVCNAEGECW